MGDTERIVRVRKIMMRWLNGEMTADEAMSQIAELM